nr:hypothetical protein Iba_chr12bCG3450 [Ipomoea batatas]GME16225.1 hypothetical protein Iba_scaffold17214CG0110 [Ipomoea batatas]
MRSRNVFANAHCKPDVRVFFSSSSSRQWASHLASPLASVNPLLPSIDSQMMELIKSVGTYECIHILENRKICENLSTDSFSATYSADNTMDNALQRL